MRGNGSAGLVKADFRLVPNELKRIRIDGKWRDITSPQCDIVSALRPPACLPYQNWAEPEKNKPSKVMEASTSSTSTLKSNIL